MARARCGEYMGTIGGVMDAMRIGVCVVVGWCVVDVLSRWPK